MRLLRVKESEVDCEFPAQPASSGKGSNDMAQTKESKGNKDDPY